MLGNERRWHMFSDVALHKEAARLFAKLGIPLRDTTLPIRALSGGQRQMVAVARAMAHNPRLLLLDEPTASLGMQEAALVERLITRLREQGTTILLSCHDTGLMFRLSDRIVVLRHGRVVTEVSTDEVRPDDVMALIAGQAVDSSARRQLTRLHGLTGRLVSSDPSSSLSLILSALGAALGSERLCIHLVDDGAADQGRVLRGARARCSTRGRGCRSGRRAARSGWRPSGRRRSSRTTSRPTRARGGASATWPGRPRSPAPGRCRCSARAGCSASSPCSGRCRASPAATTSTWPRSTPATPPARSSATGCSTR